MTVSEDEKSSMWGCSCGISDSVACSCHRVWDGKHSIGVPPTSGAAHPRLGQVGDAQSFPKENIIK